MANPLKVLTQLTASREAQFAEVVEMQKTVTISGAEADLIVSGGGEISGSAELKIAGASSLGSSLDVKGASALSGTLGVVGVASLQSTLDVAGVAAFASDVSASAGLDVVGAAHVGGAFDMDSTLNVDGAATLDIGGAAHIAGAAQLDSTLSVDGNADFDGTLAVVGNISTQASASVEGDLDVNGLADIAGNLDVHGNAVIYGNLEVKGVTTTINSTTVTVADANIQLATVESPTNATADGAGFTIQGDGVKTFQWNNDGHGFTSSEHMNLASDKYYKINGKEVVAEHGGGMIFAADAAAGTAYVQVTNNNKINILGNAEADDAVKLDAVNGGAEIVASTKIKLQAPFIDVQGDLSGSAGLDLVGAAHIGGALDVDSASNFDGAVDMNSTLAVDGVASFASDVTASANLNVAGEGSLGSLLVSSNGYFSGSLSVENIFNAKSTSFFDGTVDIDGVASFASDITASANMSVAGAMSVANTASVGALQAASDSSVGGQFSVLGNFTAQSEMLVSGLTNLNSNLNVGGIASFSSAISASAGVELASTMRVVGAVDMNTTLDVDGQADFHSNVGMDAALELSGTTFVNIATPIVNDKYNVNDAIRALDAMVGTQGSNINSNYAALRYLASDSFDAQGMKTFVSPFAAADIEKVTVDVLVQAGGSGPWTNDLLSVQVKAGGASNAFVAFEISAPAMGASDKVRVIAVKEEGNLA